MVREHSARAQPVQDDGAVVAGRTGAHYLDSTGEPPFIRQVFALDAVATANGASVVVRAFGCDYVPGNLAGALALTKAGERARHAVEIGYFLTRAGRGDEVRYRSTLRDAWTLTTGGTRASLVGSAVEDAFAYRPPRVGGPARLTHGPPAPASSPSTRRASPGGR
ncbi:hypothetical protein ACH5AU_19875 [Streptomyces albidoflavus]